MRTLSILALLTSTSALTVVACSDDETTPPPTTTTTTASTGGSGGEGATGGTGGTGGVGAMGGGGSGGSAIAFNELATFDATAGELAEGLAVTDDTAYVGFAGNGQIVEVTLADGTVTPFGNTPAFGPNGAFFLGLAVDGAGNVYGGLASFDAAPASGIYRWTPAGGAQALPWAIDPNMVVPNGLAFDAEENLYVSDSSGKIFKITPTPVVTTWLDDPLLAGDMDNCANAVTPFDIGANGIVVDGNTVYVANTNMGTIVSIPVENDGTAGTPTIFAGPDCDLLGGADGLAMSNGILYVTVNSSLNGLAAVDANGDVTILHSGDPLQSPASAAFGGPNGNLYITNAAFAPNQTPGLIEVTLP